MMILRLQIILMCLLANAMLYFGKLFYRPFIYQNQYFDCYLADVFPSLLSVPILSLGCLAFNPRYCLKYYSIMGITVLSLLIELLDDNTVDFKDIIAILLGAGIAVLLSESIKKKYFMS
ncbi:MULTISPECIES: hypothetical protein [Bacteroides]|uniref:hypothetical protein n=1 Tax=Bacteroides TaxID=816 RepID=UPI000694F570|nr:hypothetical protein [Bacteroides neonati]